MSTQTEDIKNRLDIVQLIGEYVQLKRAGANYKALCPFHGEKTPSFMVSQEKQIWRCFGCQTGGDVFEFIKKIENLEFPEALKILAKKAGVVLQYVDPQMQNKKTKLMDILQDAARFYHRFLQDDTHTSAAREYLKRRGLNSETIEEFQIGYAPANWDSLLQFLRGKKYFDMDIFDSGLIIKKERGGYYDRFRNRIMFPIFNIHGENVGFTGRLLEDGSSAETMGGKYVNTPSTLVYDKSRVIYGFDKAKHEIKKKNLAILVEGQMDLISSHQMGVRNVIAISGTALTEEQLFQLKRYTNNIALAYDMDEAGRNASDRAVEIALQKEMNITIISTSGGKDPDECIRTNPSDWTDAIERALPVSEYYLSLAFKKYDPSSLDGKKQIADFFLFYLTKVSSPLEQEHFRKLLSEKLSIDENMLNDIFSSLMKKNKKSGAKARSVSSEKDLEKKEFLTDAALEMKRNNILSQRFLSILIHSPKYLSSAINQIPHEMVVYPPFQKLYKEFIIYYTQITSQEFHERKFDVPFEQYLENLDEKGILQSHQELRMFFEKDFESLTPPLLEKEFFQVVSLLRREYYSKRLRDIEREIKRREKEGGEKEIEEMMNEFRLLAEKLRECG